ncbi:MotA/TolQ/ExbB proton channel family protein [Roseobacter sp. HKCC-CH-9208]|uniref:MotA/TolQ/ExbB proton channel family protein n=1 Tax=Roseobacter sp. HKCC-CH-9208 TaxID=3120339 RepID=UPI0030EDEB54
MIELLLKGGPILMLIAALSVISLAVILWKISQLLRLGALRSGQTTDAAISQWCAGEDVSAVLAARSGMRAEFARDAIRLRESPDWDESSRKEEIARIARARLQEISAGLRALELVVTIAPLLGLLGTVLGMIDAFQALQLEGGNADPATLAGGIWAALLTTAAGMTVAIPVAMCLTWFDTIHDKMRHSFEDIATRIFAIKGPAA